MEKTITLPEKPFLSLEEAANKLRCKPAQLLEYALVRESQTQRFGQLRAHAIFPVEMLKSAKMSFISYDQSPFRHSNFLVSSDMDYLFNTSDNTDINSDKWLDDQIELSIQEDYELEREQFKLNDYGNYHPDVTTTPKNFILLDIETLIEFFSSETINVSRAYLEGFDEELVEVDFSRLENRIQISKSNLRFFLSDLDILIKSQVEVTENKNEKPLASKEKSYLLAIIGVLIEGNKWSIQDKDLAQKIMTLSESTNYAIEIRTLRKHLDTLKREHFGFRKA